ncbi:MAG: PRTase ComF-like [Acidobacteriota bacterium]|jgi:predicted amidophosphoribosyltransferase|nr:PRTase ComF-like [Acidobacteriota bacterium]
MRFSGEEQVRHEECRPDDPALAAESPPCAARPKVASPYRRNHNVSALYTVSARNVKNFRRAVGKEFSMFKYGDPQTRRIFAERIAEEVWREAGREIAADPQAWRVVCPAYHGAPTAAALLAEEVRHVLAHARGVELAAVRLHRRNPPRGDFGELRSHGARERRISGNFFYTGESLAGLTLIFVDDVLVSGAHYRETQRVLERHAGVSPASIRGCFIVDLKAKGFAGTKQAAEGILNHLWVGSGRAERLIEVLQKPGVGLTPRLLRMLAEFPWEVSEGLFNRLDHQTVLSLLHACRLELLHTDAAHSDWVGRLDRYAAQRLRGAKEGVSLRALYELDEAGVLRFIEEKAVTHPLFARPLSRGEMYSLLKFGDGHAVEYFAASLAGEVAPFVEGSGLSGVSWAVAAPGYEGITGSAGLLARRVGELLNLPLIGVNRRDVPEATYGKLADARERYAYVRAGEYTLSGGDFANVILIEDAVVSGANLNRQRRLLADGGAEVFPFAVIDVTAPRPALEEELNGASACGGSGEVLLKLLGDPRTKVVARTVKTLLALPAARLELLLAELGAQRCVELFNAARRAGIDLKPSFGEGFRVLQRHVNGEARARKGCALPPYESIFVVTRANAAEMTSMEGLAYSGFKYGERKSIDALAGRMVSTVRQSLGHRLRDQPQRFVVAATHHFRIPNAAAHLGAEVARRLGLEFADVRRRQIFEGEFGAIGDARLRRALIAGNAYCSNPGQVAGREVVYIDDAFVSGAHLAEHCEAFWAAGAANVHPFAVFDVADPDLTLERTLNHARVNSDSPGKLLDILRDPSAPVLTRALKLTLKLPPGKLEEMLLSLPNERVFDLYEAASVEGYDREASMSCGFEILRARAEERHRCAMVEESRVLTRRYSVMIFDYDETLGRTLMPPSEEMLECLTFFLARGTEIGVISLQPHGERGLRDTLVNPIRSFINGRGWETTLLTKLHLLPSEGVIAYRLDGLGRMDEGSYSFNLGFRPGEWEAFERLVLGGRPGACALRVYRRGSYISLHYDCKESMRAAQEELKDALANFRPCVEIRRKIASDPRKHVLHVRLSGVTKALGRDYMVRSLREAALRSGRLIPRHDILVVGDKMGVSEGEDDDSAMFVYGGVNFSVGVEARPGAYTGFLNMREAGTLALLMRLRASY